MPSKSNKELQVESVFAKYGAFSQKSLRFIPLDTWRGRSLFNLDTKAPMDPPSREWFENATKASFGAGLLGDAPFSASDCFRYLKPLCVDCKSKLDRLDAEERMLRDALSAGPGSRSASHWKPGLTPRYNDGSIDRSNGRYNDGSNGRSYDGSNDGSYDGSCNGSEPQPCCTDSDAVVPRLAIDGFGARVITPHPVIASHGDPLIVALSLPYATRLTPGLQPHLSQRLHEISSEKAEVLAESFAAMCKVRPARIRGQAYLSVYPRSLGSLDFVDFLAADMPSK